jgi:NADP-dependent 3-hydroxy acid dehydrogenase YdfG
MTLTGKTAIVTGASSGIGEATARRLVEGGCNVVLAARREDRLERLVEELGEKAIPVPTDVTDAADCASLVARTIEHFGGLDILVNNAGLGFYGSIAEGNPEDWRTMFDVNVLGVLYVTRAAVRHMLENGSGDIVFISSIAGRRVPTPEATVYAATKHTVNAIAEGLRMDLTDKGIRSVTVEPGLVRTEFPEGPDSSAEEFYASKDYTPLKAEDIAGAVLYALEQPDRVSVNEILVRSTEQTR